MKGVSVYLVVLNEAHNIRRVLDSVQGCDDIVIVDSGSVDETLAIARQYTDRIYHKDWQGMAQQKEYAKSLCRHEWVLNLDADEQLSEPLKQQIQTLVANTDYHGAWIPIREHFLGQRLHRATHKNSHVRLFRKQLGHYGTERFHESPQVSAPLTRLSGEINHFGEVSVAVKVDKINRYSSGKAEDKYERGKRSRLAKLVLILPLMFIKSYLLRRNFLNGRRGFIASVINAGYAFLKEAKLYELELQQSEHEKPSKHTQQPELDQSRNRQEH